MTDRQSGDETVRRLLQSDPAISVLAPIVRSLSRRTSIEIALAEVVAQCVGAAGLSSGAVLLRDEGSSWRCAAQIGFEADALTHTIEVFGPTPTLDQILGAPGPVTITPGATDIEGADQVLQRLGASTAIVAPIASGTETLGVLLLTSATRLLLGEEWRAFAHAIASQLGQAVALSRAFVRLTESEARYAAILDAALDAVITIDASGVITGWNRVAETTFGWPADEALGHVMATMIVPSQHRAAHQRGLAHFLATGEGAMLNRRIEITAMNRGGREFPVELTISPVKVRDVWVFSAFVRDITERKGLEAQLIQAQKLEAVGMLAGGIAHDFNNLLGAITVFGELATGDIPAGDPRRVDLDSIQETVQRATTLTRQLLAFSRQQVLRPVVLDPNAVITDVLKILSRLIGENIELVMQLDEDAGLVRADAGQVEQVLLNLAVNARDAMPLGGRLVIATSGAELDDDAARARGLAPGGYVVLTVTDTGSGMTPEVRAHVFEPFFTTKGAKGTGIGLATVHGIVRQSDGHIAVASEPGHGATFTIHLPRVTGATAEMPVAASKSASAGGSETILLAEDDPALRLATSTVLKRLGYQVLATRSAEEALAKAREYTGQIHLVVSDVVMPGINGLELVGQLRQSRRELKALLTSGYAGDAMARHGVIESGIPFLEKPFSSSALASRVREVLDTDAAPAV